MQSCFVQLVSLYSPEIKSARVSCEMSVCALPLVYSRDSVWPALLPASSFISQAERSTVCISVCSPFVQVFCRGSVFLYRPLSGKSVPHWRVSVCYDNVGAVAPHLPGADNVFCVLPVSKCSKLSLCQILSHRSCSLSSFALFECYRHINVDLSVYKRSTEDLNLNVITELPPPPWGHKFSG